MSHHFEFTGSNLEEALQNAARELQVSLDDMQYRIISQAQSDTDEVLVRVFLGKTRDTQPKFHKKNGKSTTYKKNFSREPIMEIQEFFTPIDDVLEQSIPIQKILLFLKDILSFFEIPLEGFYVEEKEAETYINLQCEQAGILIGKQGAVLNSIQFVLGAYIPKMLLELENHNLPKTTFTIDIHSYRLKRMRFLHQLVDQAISKIHSNSEGVLIDGEFSPIERRQIHLYVQTQPGFTTESQGETFLKPILIKPIE